MTGQRVTDPHLMITDFYVYDLGASGWRAVHSANHELTIEAETWEQLQAHCIGERIRHSLLTGFGASSWSEAIANEHHTEAGS